MARGINDKHKHGMNVVYKELSAQGHEDRFARYAQYMYYAKRLSLYNCAMIMLQRPSAMYVADREEWASYNRIVKPSAAAICILQPSGPHKVVYEYGDTMLIAGMNDCTPEEFRSIPPQGKSANFESSWLPVFIKMLKNLGIAYSEDYLSENRGGAAMYLDEAIELYPELSHNGTGTHFLVSVRKEDSNDQKARTILHEAAHVLCGHFGTRSGNKKCKPIDRGSEFHCRDDANSIMEYEAELTKDYICKILGIENDSKEYLASWKYRGEVPKYDIGIVLDTADKILHAIDKKFTEHLLSPACHKKR